MKWIFNDSGGPLILIGSVVEDQAFYRIEQKELLSWQTSPDIEELVLSGDLGVSFDGTNLIANADAALAYLRSFANFPSTWAVDKFDAESDLPVDQVVTTTTPTVITAERPLWDLLSDFDLATAAFSPKLNGIWNLNGTVTLKSFTNVKKASIDIYRNGALWFTVAEKVVGSESTVSLTFSCDVDAYATYSHVFDLRLRLEKTVSLDPVSATVSGLEEETAWGMTFLHVLTQASPT